MDSDDISKNVLEMFKNPTSENSNYLTCSICYDRTTNKTKCDHFVCKPCISKMNKAFCPICRTPIDNLSPISNTNIARNINNTSVENVMKHNLARNIEEIIIDRFYLHNNQFNIYQIIFNIIDDCAFIDINKQFDQNTQREILLTITKELSNYYNVDINLLYSILLDNKNSLFAR